MSSNLLLHLDQPLDQAGQHSLRQSIAARFGVSSADAHASHRSHLLFVPLQLNQVMPHQVVDFVRAQGYPARIVDL